jgi:hypothetical protein
VQYLIERTEFFRESGCVEFRHVAHGSSLPFRSEVLCSPR